MNPPTVNAARREANRRHWDGTLDPRNLRAGAGKGSDWRREAELARTADVRRAMRMLGPLDGRLILDLGGGLGLHALLFAERGAHVIVADLSLERLRAARRLAREAGMLDRVSFVLCGAEELPFRNAVIDRQFTKSVLIHTTLPAASRELARTLAAGGRAAHVEPLTANPFVNLYRRLAAPRAWRHITNYFDNRSIAILAAAHRGCGAVVVVRRLYFIAFFASVFHFLLPAPSLRRGVEKVLLAIDAVLFSLVPGLRRRCWFAVIGIRKG